MGSIAGKVPGLLDRAKEGEKQAFRALFEAHAGRIHSFTLRTLEDRTAAENLTREIFIEAFSDLDSVEDQTEFADRLYREATKKVFLSHLKRGSDRLKHQHPSHEHLSFMGQTHAPMNAKSEAN
ncbi:MAG: RNA polymerase sigma factor [Terriglobales bacterium]